MHQSRFALLRISLSGQSMLQLHSTQHQLCERLGNVAVHMMLQVGCPLFFAVKSFKVPCIVKTLFKPSNATIKLHFSNVSDDCKCISKLRCTLEPSNKFVPAASILRQFETAEPSARLKRLMALLLEYGLEPRKTHTESSCGSQPGKDKFTSSHRGYWRDSKH